VQVDNLVTLGKVWGFVKYRHPKVTAAEVQWDYELFRVLPPVLAAKDRASANAAIEAWLAKLGDPAPCKPCAQEVANAQMPPRLAWIGDRARLGDALVRRLALIHERRDADGEQYYVSAQRVGAPDFSNELAYATPSPPDAGYRLLALYRFWNIVESWYPYRDVMNEDWDGVLATFVPRMFAATTATEYAREMMKVVARVHDSHVNLWGSLALRPPAGECGLPTPLRYVDGQFVVAELPDTTRKDPEGLLPGDAIVAIDGVPVKNQLGDWLPYYGASNEDAARRDVALALMNGACGPVRVQRDRGGKLEEVTLQRTTFSPWMSPRTHDRQCQTFVRASDDLAYLKLSSVLMADAEDYVRRSQGARVLIIDVRNYPSQFMVFALGRHLVASKTEFATFTMADFANPGTFVWRPGVPLEPKEPHFGGKVVVLVDEVSQSQAEYTTLAFRSAPDAIVVGSTTAGADGNVASIALPGGLRTMISGLGVFTADRKPTQRVGIVPDVVVRPTRAGLAAGRDEVLETAVQHGLGRSLTAAELGNLGLKR
jgi:C-terminal processing protease CtpA/Prc